jgi:hypothetical protein
MRRSIRAAAIPIAICMVLAADRGDGRRGPSRRDGAAALVLLLDLHAEPGDRPAQRPGAKGGIR